MEIKPYEIAVATTSVGFAALTYSITNFGGYSGGGHEFVFPLVGLAWSLSEVISRRRASSDQGDDADAVDAVEQPEPEGTVEPESPARGDADDAQGGLLA